MNKIIAILLLVLGLLGMALVMLNDQLTPRNDAYTEAQTASSRFPTLPALPQASEERPATEARVRELPPLPESLELPGTVRAPISDDATPDPTPTPLIDGSVTISSELAAPAVAPRAMPAPADGLAEGGTTPDTATQAPQGGQATQQPENREPATIVVSDEHFAEPADVAATPAMDPAEPAPQEAAAQAPSAQGNQGTRAANALGKPAADVTPKAAVQDETKPATRAEAKSTPKAETKKASPEEKQPKKAQQPKKARQCTVTVFAREGGATVRLTGSDNMKYKTIRLVKPDRVVVDLEGRWEVTTQAIPRNSMVNNVRVGHLPNMGTRVVVDLYATPRVPAKVHQPNGLKQIDVRVDK